LGRCALSCVLIIGFPIALILAWAFELTPEGIKLTESADREAAKPSRNKAWIYVVIVAAADLDRALPCWSPHCAKAKCRDAGQGKSIAVLPFENLSRDPDNAYSHDGSGGNTDAIGENRRSESYLAHLNAAIPEQTWQFGPEIGRQLGVAHILEGSVQKAAIRSGQCPVDQCDHRCAPLGGTYDRKLTTFFR